MQSNFDINNAEVVKASQVNPANKWRYAVGALVILGVVGAIFIIIAASKQQKLLDYDYSRSIVVLTPLGKLFLSGLVFTGVSITGITGLALGSVLTERVQKKAENWGTLRKAIYKNRWKIATATLVALLILGVLLASTNGRYIYNVDWLSGACSFNEKGVRVILGTLVGGAALINLAGMGIARKLNPPKPQEIAN